MGGREGGFSGKEKNTPPKRNPAAHMNVKNGRGAHS